MKRNHDCDNTEITSGKLPHNLLPKAQHEVLKKEKPIKPSMVFVGLKTKPKTKPKKSV